MTPGRRARGLARWWARCTRFKGRAKKNGPSAALSPLRQMAIHCGMEVDSRGQMQPRPWHDPGPFRHFTRDIYGREVLVEYLDNSKREVTIL